MPVLYLPYFRGSSKLLIYFHGNAEDLGLSYELVDHLRTSLEMHVMSVEYPGYGAYVGTPSAEALINDIENLFSYITTNLQWNSKNIIAFGRSIGSGPATHIAAKYNL